MIHVFTKANLISFMALYIFLWSGAPEARLQRGIASEENTQDRERRLRSVAVMDRLVDLARAELRKPENQVGDPALKAASLGYDVNRIFGFVRDEIRLEPYRGRLRGARGTLACGAGNSLDQALLLQALLDAGGHRTRLVHAPLSPPKAETLVDQFLATGSSKGPIGKFDSTPVNPGTQLKEIGTRAGLDLASLSKGMERDQEEARSLFENARETTRQVSAYFRSRLDAAGIELGLSRDAWKKKLADRLADHAWVQVYDRKWVDLDPSFAGSSAGEKHADPAAPLKRTLADEHRLRFTLFYGRSVSGKTKREAILDAYIPMEDALFHHANFTIEPARNAPGLSKLVKMKPDQIASAFAAIDRFQANLRLGGKTFSSRAFDLEGKLYNTAGGQLGSVLDLGGALKNAFNFGGREKEKAEFVDLSVRLSMEGPGNRWEQRRIITTREDTTGNDFTSPILGWEILVQPHVIPETLAATGMLRHTVETVARSLAVLRKDVVTMKDVESYTGKPAAPYPAFLIQYALFRQRAIAEMLRENPSIRLLWDTPQVFIAENRLCVHKDEGELCKRIRFDVVENRLTFVPGEEGGKMKAARTSLESGVFDTVAEALLLQKAIPAKRFASPVIGINRARILGTELVIAHPGQEGLSKSGLDKPDLDWIRKFENPRKWILSPARDESGRPPQGWWSLDPETGTILGRAPGGGGQSMAEYGKLLLGMTLHYLCIADVVYDGVKGGGSAGVKASRIALKITRCQFLFVFGLLGMWTLAIRMVIGVLSGLLIKGTMGGAGLAGGALGIAGGIF